MRLQDDEAGMTALAITPASVLLVSAVFNTLQAVWLRYSNARADANLELANKYKDERTSLAINNATYVKQAGENEAKIRVLSALLKDADKRNADNKVKEIAGAPTNAAAAAAFGSGFSVPVLPKAGDSDPGGNDR